jgi:4-cresol dehydrogenase (hydroxylating)
MCAPVVPFEGRHVRAAARIVERTMLRHGVDPIMTLACVDARCVHVLPMIIFDREAPGEDDRALACERAMMSALVAKGYYPYRLGVHSMRPPPEPSAESRALMARLKRALDPSGILAPGRYEL